MELTNDYKALIIAYWIGFAMFISAFGLMLATLKFGELAWMLYLGAAITVGSESIRTYLAIKRKHVLEFYVENGRIGLRLHSELEANKNFHWFRVEINKHEFKV